MNPCCESAHVVRHCIDEAQRIRPGVRISIGGVVYRVGGPSRHYPDMYEIYGEHNPRNESHRLRALECGALDYEIDRWRPRWECYRGWALDWAIVHEPETVRMATLWDGVIDTFKTESELNGWKPTQGVLL